MSISISNIQINPIKPQGSLVGFCSFEISHENFRLFLGDIAIHSSPSVGFRLVYPERVMWNGLKANVICPLNRGTQLMIQDVVIKQYERIITESINAREKKFEQKGAYREEKQRG